MKKYKQLLSEKKNPILLKNNVQTKKITRRNFITTALKGVGALSAAAFGPFVRTSKAAKLELRPLAWASLYYYKDQIKLFESKFDCKILPTDFATNGEAYELLITPGGLENYDILMADGFWPRIYAKESLIQPINYKRIPNLKYMFPAFLPPNFRLFKNEKDADMIAVPYCWGGYAITANMNKIADEELNSLSLLYNPKYRKRIATGVSMEENIALTGILVANRLGTINKQRPDGKPFNPYVLTDQELEECKRLLQQQKPLILIRWDTSETLERLLRAEAIWASPDWGQAYRKLTYDYLTGKSNTKFKYMMFPDEGGLGWVDSHMITSSVKHSEKLELCYEWINFQISQDNMALVNESGMASTIDTRKLIPKMFVDTLFLNQTDNVKKLYMFGKPSNPQKWKEIWNKVETYQGI